MSTDTPAAPPPPRHLLLWGVLATAVLGLLLATGLVATRRPEPLPRLGALPDFTFTRENGQPFGRAQLQGRPWVANFIFTRCPTICPVFTQKMARVQQHTARHGEGLRLVSFSVDPDYDTPERLTAYAAKYGAQPARWSFLTGDYTRLKSTIVDGFKVAMGRHNEDAQDILGIFHGTHFVLVDASGEIRGYYNSDDDEALERLLRDTGRLVEGGE
jgi:protein SCO1/2